MMTELQALERLRALCADFPECMETVSLGHPTFKAGRKTFALVEMISGRRAVVLHPGPECTDRAKAAPGFLPLPYTTRPGWVAVELDEKTDWNHLKRLLTCSYKRVALKRMIEALGPLAA